MGRRGRRGAGGGAPGRPRLPGERLTWPRTRPSASTPPTACEGELRRRPTSRSPTARRSSARWRAEPVRVRNYLDAADTNSSLQRGPRPRRDRRGRRATSSRSAAPGCATPRVPGRPDRRRQRRHAHAAAARLAGRPGGPRVHPRRRRLDPPPARRPHRRRRCGRWARRSTPRDGRLPPFTVTGGAAARHPLRAAGRQRPGQVVRRCSPRSPPTAPTTIVRARSRAATTPSGCSPPPASTSAATGAQVTIAGADELALATS